MKIGPVDVVPTAKATFKDFREDDIQGLAAEVTYHLLFSIVPLLIFLTALSGFIGQWVGPRDVVGDVTDWLLNDSGLPADVARAAITPIRDILQNESGGFLSFGALLALWGGKNALAAMMKALNVAFDVKETRPWWKKTAIAMGLTIALGVALIASSLFFLAGSMIGETVAGWIGLGSAWTTVWGILRWPLIVALLATSLAFFYWAGPNVNAPFKWLTPGSIVAVVLWGVATFALSIYFRFFAGYVETYGALGAVLAAVFWLYVMSLILLLGGELNSVLAVGLDPATQAQVADPARAMSAVGAKRGGASGKSSSAAAEDGAPFPEIPAPAPLPAFSDLAAALPSAERQALSALTAEGSAGRERRARSALAALAAAAVAAISGALLGAGRR